MRRCLVVVACAGCGRVGFDIAPAANGYRKAIAVRYAGATLTNFPVSVVLAGDGDLAAHARADGGDVQFEGASGRLDCEVVSYDAGSLEAWVRVPAIATGDTTFYVTYGGAPRAGDPAATWASDTFAGVWHLAESGTTARDSTL